MDDVKSSCKHDVASRDLQLLLVNPPSEKTAAVVRSCAAPKFAVVLKAQGQQPAVAIVWSDPSAQRSLTNLRERSATTFTIAVVDDASLLRHGPSLRLASFSAGARMVVDADNLFESLGVALDRIARMLSSGGTLSCRICGLANLDEAALRAHSDLFHQCEPNQQATCPICGLEHSAIGYHLHNEHGPVDSREPPPPPYPAFAWCVVRRPSDGKFLLVHEPAAIAGGLPRFWLPAGRLDAGEGFVEAARRECLEEAGVAVEPTGVLKLMAEGGEPPACVRVALLCEPVGDAKLKQVPCWESVGACWVSLEELGTLRRKDFRSADPLGLFPAVASGELMPRSVHTDEWRALESAVSMLTSDEGEAGEAALREAWPRIRDAFREA